MDAIAFEPRPVSLDYSQWVTGLVSAFGRARLTAPSDTFNTGDVPELTSAPPPLPIPLQQLVHQHHLNPAEQFLLCVLGSLEESHWLNLAIAELQAPMAAPWLPVHLAVALTQSLFQSQLTPLTLCHHRLVQSGVIQLHGDGPLPTRSLNIDSQLWLALSGQPVSASPITLTQVIPLSAMDLDALHGCCHAIRLGQTKALVLRGHEGGVGQFASELAERLNKQPVRVNAERWRDHPSQPLIAQAQQWLPLLELTLTSSETYALPKTDVPVVVHLQGEGQIRCASTMEWTLTPLSREQRQQLWQTLVPEEDAKRLATNCLMSHDITRLGLNQAKATHGAALRQARERLSHSQLNQLASLVSRHVSREALVIPEAVAAPLAQLLQRCQRRETLWQQLGVTSQMSQNTGVRALFSGESGTGKTLAASYIASELQAPLYRLDLAAVLNKYIGETEKNLGRLLDEAAHSDAILLMDEADSLFGKRTEGDHAGDRFANSLTNYLLTRIETHPGIVLLTTNGRARMDAAFTRRLDFIIEFTRPGAAERLQLWQTHLGERNPSDDFCTLLAAYSDLSGGFIRNAVINAATVVPADSQQRIPEAALLNALYAEYQKLGQPVPNKLQQLAAQQEVTPHG